VNYFVSANVSSPYVMN